jgi:hypothetical protein
MVFTAAMVSGIAIAAAAGNAPAPTSDTGAGLLRLAANEIPKPPDIGPPPDATDNVNDDDDNAAPPPDDDDDNAAPPPDDDDDAAPPPDDDDGPVIEDDDAPPPPDDDDAGPPPDDDDDAGPPPPDDDGPVIEDDDAINASFDGKWRSHSDNGGHYTMTMQQDGLTVNGTYTSQNNRKGSLAGTLDDEHTFDFVWQQEGGFKGTGQFVLSDDGNHFTGEYTITKWPGKKPKRVHGEWNGERRSQKGAGGSAG